MKSVQCDLCKVFVRGETFESWMEALMPHYTEAHSDVMNDPKNTQEEKQKWMAENRNRFESAENSHECG